MPLSALLLLAAGAAAILCMVWVALAALTAGRAGRAAVLLAAALALAGGPSLMMRIRAAGASPPDAAVALGAGLLIAAAMLALWRLRGVEGAGLPARAGLFALAALGLVLAGLELG